MHHVVKSQAGLPIATPIAAINRPEAQRSTEEFKRGDLNPSSAVPVGGTLPGTVKFMTVRQMGALMSNTVV